MDFSSINIYWLMIGVSLVIIVSYFYNYIAGITKIPSVILLIATGFIGSIFMPVDFDVLKPFLEFLGAVGLIMIVLEASLDLELKREKAPLLLKAILSSIVLLLVGSLGIGLLIQFFFEEDFIKCLAYSIPLSVMSSAIIIPSVGHLDENRKEFLIYEASFSDIFGIMFFYFLLDSMDYETSGAVAGHVVTNIIITLIVSFVLGYLIILLMQKVTAHVKLFLPIAVLILLYSIGKLFHLSSLIFILVFGLMVNNRELFFKKRLMRIFQKSKFEETLDDLKIITLESSFIVRTFFFIVFGMTITAEGLNDPLVYVLGIGSIIILYASRLGMIWSVAKQSVNPAVYISPRGLITILLFFAIPEELEIENFRPAILLLIILVSNLVMTYGLMKHKPDGEKEKEEKNEDISKAVSEALVENQSDEKTSSSEPASLENSQENDGGSNGDSPEKS